MPTSCICNFHHRWTRCENSHTPTRSDNDRDFKRLNAFLPNLVCLCT